MDIEEFQTSCMRFKFYVIQILVFLVKIGPNPLGGNTNKSIESSKARFKEVD